MSIIRYTRYTLGDTSKVQFLAMRSTLIRSIHERFPGLDSTRLVHLDDDTWVDAWEWQSPEHLAAVQAAVPEIPGAMDALRRLENATVEQGVLVDQA